MDSSTDEKVHENRLRRMAERQGYKLRKSRRRDPRALDYGEMWLERDVDVDGERRAWEWGPWRDLADLERFLTVESASPTDWLRKSPGGES